MPNRGSDISSASSKAGDYIYIFYLYVFDYVFDVMLSHLPQILSIIYRSIVWYWFSSFES